MEGIRTINYTSAKTPVVATVDNAHSWLRSGRTIPGVSHFKRSARIELTYHAKHSDSFETF